MPVDAILVGREDDANRKYNYVLVLGPENFNAQYETAASEFDHIVTAPGVTPGTWYHAVATRSINGEHKIYLDGELEDSGNWIDTPVQNNENLIIARYVDSYPYSDRFFNGCLDDVRIYNRALSDSEIQALFNQTVTIVVDIKPGSCPNPLNIKSKGVLPAAIVGTADFDVATVDPASVLLEGVAPLRWAYEDVATPFESFIGEEDCREDCHEIGPDGYYDLTLKYSAQEVIAGLGEVRDGDCLVLTLTGNLKEEFGSIPIVGEDVVIILKK